MSVGSIVPPGGTTLGGAIPSEPIWRLTGRKSLYRPGMLDQAGRVVVNPRAAFTCLYPPMIGKHRCSVPFVFLLRFAYCINQGSRLILHALI